MADLNGIIGAGIAAVGATGNLGGKGRAREWENNFLSSDWAKYWDGVDKYNTFSPSLINQANENNGISPNQRIRV